MRSQISFTGTSKITMWFSNFRDLKQYTMNYGRLCEMGMDSFLFFGKNYLYLYFLDLHCPINQPWHTPL